MVSITFSVEESILKKMEHFSWVNWSEVAREEILKKEIFERFIKTRKISKEDQNFCEKIDWHPVDLLPLKKEFVKEIQKIKKKKGKTFKSVAELRKHLKNA